MKNFSNLSMEEKIKFWNEVETILREVIKECSTLLPERDLEWAADYLDHNELGLAREILLNAIEEYEVSLSEKAERLLWLASKKNGLQTAQR